MPNLLKEGPDNQHWRTLPEICMAMHMLHTGSCEDMTDAEHDEAVAYLNSRVEHWGHRSNGARWYTFDTSVLALCLATLEEAKHFIKATKVQVVG